MTSPRKSASNLREVELKFQLPEGSRILLERYPALAAAAPAHHHLVSTYFDTPDRVLEGWGLTLRVRRDGERRIQTVKSRLDGHGVAASRGEWEWLIGQDTPDLAWLSQTPRLAIAANEIKGRLQPAFITNIRRTTRLVDLGEDTTVEVAFDEGDIEAGLDHEAVSELEIELKSGGVGPLYRFAAALLSTAPMWLMSEGKASRGWRLRTGENEGAQVARRPKVKKTVSVAEGFHQVFAGTLGHLTANIGPALHGDAEGLHELRLALVEARATLILFAHYLDAESTARFKNALGSYAKLLGRARDWDVFCIETLPSAMGDLSGWTLGHLQAAAEVERQLAHKAVTIALMGREFSKLVLDLAIWSSAPVFAPSQQGDVTADRHLSALAPLLFDRAARKVRRRGQHVSTLSQMQRHSLRKSLKKLSFGVDSLSRLYREKRVSRYLGRCGALETILGAANDAAVTNRLLQSLTTPAHPDLSKPARALEKWNTARGRKALTNLKAAMRSLRRAPAFWPRARSRVAP